MAFRDVLPSREGAQSLADRSEGEVFFLACRNNIEAGKFIDVPDHFVKLFSDELGIEVKPISKAMKTPAAEQALDQPLYRDIQSGRRGRVYYVSEIRWIDADEVELEIGELTAPLVANGMTITLERIDGSWTIVKRRNRWMS